MHEHSSLHTHSLGRFWRPWIRASRVLYIFLYCSGVRVIVRFARRLEFLPFDSGILASCYSYFYTFFDSMYIKFSLYSSPFIWCHAWMLICNIAVIVDLLWFRFITCSGSFRLSMYTGGIFLASPTLVATLFSRMLGLSLIHIWRCRRSTLCRSRWSPYH